MKKPWAFIRFPYMSPTILEVIGPRFLNQVPTLPDITITYSNFFVGSSCMLLPVCSRQPCMLLCPSLLQPIQPTEMTRKLTAR